MYNKNQRIAMFVNRNSYKDLPRQDMLREHIFLQILAIFVKIFSYKECVREHMFFANNCNICQRIFKTKNVLEDTYSIKSYQFKNKI